MLRGEFCLANQYAGHSGCTIDETVIPECYLFNRWRFCRWRFDGFGRSVQTFNWLVLCSVTYLLYWTSEQTVGARRNNKTLWLKDHIVSTLAPFSTFDLREAEDLPTTRNKVSIMAGGAVLARLIQKMHVMRLVNVSDIPVSCISQSWCMVPLPELCWSVVVHIGKTIGVIWSSPQSHLLRYSFGTISLPSGWRLN